MANQSKEVGTGNSRWIEKYAHALNGSGGDLSALSSDERKHLRILLRQYATEQQLAVLSESLSQLPLESKEA